MPSLEPRSRAPRQRTAPAGACAGLGLARAEGESEDGWENRRATALMALYRDTRSPADFDALYGMTRDGVLLWIQSLLRRSRLPIDPAELLQDTFVNVYRYPSAFREEHAGSFRVWVRTIAGNLVRRASSARRRSNFHELPDGVLEPEDGRGSPALCAEHGEEAETLSSAWVLFLLHYAAAFAELGARDQQALHLVEVEGRSYAEAGLILAVGRSNMKMIVFRARHRLARRMRTAMSGAPREGAARARAVLAGAA